LADNRILIDDFNPPAIAHKIAKKMKSMRIEQNMTQIDLARRSGVSLGSIKRFETKHEIALRKLIQIGLVLEALEGFHKLFSSSVYQTIDDVINSQTSQDRKRASRG